VLILRIRRAEVALADGRLDEAFELVQAEDVQAHRRGQKLIGRLTEAFIARANEHLEADQLTQALADCEKAQQLGGQQSEVGLLKASIAERLKDEQTAKRHEARAVADARGQIADGHLSIGENLLENVTEDRARSLRKTVDRRRKLIDAALERARAGLDREDFGTAIDAALEARSQRAPDERLDALVNDIIHRVVERVRSAIDRGRIDLAESLLEPLARLTATTIDIREQQRFIGLCRAATGSLEGGDARQAAGMLRQLQAIRPEARWIGEALGSALQAADHLDALRGGPLGLVMSTQTEVSPGPPEVVVTEPDHEPSPPTLPTGFEPVPTRFLLQLDGIGSFLVLRDSQVRIGPVSSPDRPEIGLLVDASIPTATIERTEADYFLTSGHPLKVNDIATDHKLLADGDKITLADRCRFRFHLPNAASSSAVLTFSGMRLPRSDARRAILLDRELIIGPGATAHIRADQLTEPVVLHVRDNRLVCRTDQPVLVNDRPMDRQTGIPLDANVTVGTMRFVATKV
jgi:tetratricopeptide (TPR) repeat protein